MRPTCRLQTCPMAPFSLWLDPFSGHSVWLSCCGARLLRASCIALSRRLRWPNISPTTRRHFPFRLRPSTSTPTTTHCRTSLPEEAFAGAPEAPFHPRRLLKPTCSSHLLQLALQTLATRPIVIPPIEIRLIVTRDSSLLASTLLALRLPKTWMPTNLPSA